MHLAAAALQCYYKSWRSQTNQNIMMATPMAVAMMMIMIVCSSAAGAPPYLGCYGTDELRVCVYVTQCVCEPSGPSPRALTREPEGSAMCTHFNKNG